MNRITAFIKVFILRRKLWLATVLDNGEAHCFPLGDQIRHQLDEDCICGPGATSPTKTTNPTGHTNTTPSTAEKPTNVNGTGHDTRTG